MIEGSIPSKDGETEQRFVMRTPIQIPVGWVAISLYPRATREIWNPSNAALWAENDLLAAVLQRNLRDAHFRSIDPNADARKKMALVLDDCRRLLNENEEPVHQYIRDHSQILCPTHDRMWSKLPLGAHVTDFVFRYPSGEYLLVELERPSLALFRSDGQQREELSHAIDQIVNWRRYIEDNLQTVQRELGLIGISANPACLVVIGRSSMLDTENRRKLAALESFVPKLKIMTYDDLLANAQATAENILGPLWNPGPNTEVFLLPKQ